MQIPGPNPEMQRPGAVRGILSQVRKDHGQKNVTYGNSTSRQASVRSNLSAWITSSCILPC